MNHWLALLLLFAANGLWLLFIRWLGHRGVDSEATRKAFHAGSGAMLLTLPLLFQTDLAPVVVWGLLSLAAVTLMIKAPHLRQRLAGNVYEVGRVSYGDLYFVIGVALLFFFTAQNYYLYAVPLTMLAFADAVSALVGKRFGRHKFEATEGRKSIEGSLAFFAVAFIATILWAPTLPNADPMQIVLIAVILGLVVMLLEAISWRGLDNLLIPLGGFLLLRIYLMLPLPMLVVNLAVITLLVAFVASWRKRSTLNHSALITGALFGYTAWTVASGQWGQGAGLIGLAWLLPPVLLFVLFNLLLVPLLLQEHHDRHNVDAVFGSVFAGALWLYLAFYFNRPEFIFPYCASFACVTMNIYFERRLHQGRQHALALGAVILASLVMLADALAVLWMLNSDLGWPLVVRLLVAAVAGVGVALLIQWVSVTRLSEEQYQRWRWHARGLAALAGSLVAALPLAAWRGSW